MLIKSVCFIRAEIPLKIAFGLKRFRVRPNEKGDRLTKHWIGKIFSELSPHSDENVSRVHAGWRKSGSGGEYLGVKKGVRRKIAKQEVSLPLLAIWELLSSEVMDIRSVGVFILLEQFSQGDGMEREKIFKEFLDHRDLIDDWELVDDLSPPLIGRVSDGKMTREMDLLTTSSRMWDRRMAMVSTLWPVRRGDLELAYDLSEMLCGDREPLIEKALGWILRETGKIDPIRLKSYLQAKGPSLSRTTLGYAIERFSKPEQRLFREAYNRSIGEH